MSIAEVSVVITTFNGRRFISDAVGSVLRQSYERIELIIVDDGSTDDTKHVVEQLKLPRYIWQPNAGLSAARNTGLRAARGKYVVFLDVDDVLLPNAIADGVAFFAENDECGLVFGGYLDVFSDRATAICNPAANLTFSDLLRRNAIGMHGAVMYRREKLLALGGFAEDLRAGEDWDVYLRMAKRHKIAGHGTVVSEYRHHSVNMSQDAGKMYASSIALLRRHRDEHCREAYKEGLDWINSLYLRDLLRQAIGDLPIRGRRRAALLKIGWALRFGFRSVLRAGARRFFRKRVSAQAAPYAS